MYFRIKDIESGILDIAAKIEITINKVILKDNVIRIEVLSGTNCTFWVFINSSKVILK